MKNPINKKLLRFTWLALIVWTTPIHISLAQEPFTFVKQNTSNSHFLILGANEHAVCYFAKSADKIDKVWESKGWYSFPEELFLSANGELLVRSPVTVFGTDAKIKTEIVLQFLKNGVVFKSYAANEIYDVEKPMPRFLHSPEDVILRGGKIGIIIRRNLRAIFEDESTQNIFKGGKDADEFFLIETSQFQRIVFNLSDGSIIYKGTTQ